MNNESKAINVFIETFMKKARKNFNRNILSNISALMLETCIELNGEPITLGKLRTNANFKERCKFYGHTIDIDKTKILDISVADRDTGPKRTLEQWIEFGIKDNKEEWNEGIKSIDFLKWFFSNGIKYEK